MPIEPNSTKTAESIFFDDFLLSQKIAEKKKEEEAQVLDAFKLKAQLEGSLLAFTKYFYKARTGREYVVSQPISRVSHHIEICRTLTDVVEGNRVKVMINIPPRYGKTELLIHFVAWTLAKYPDSQYLYVSVTQELALKATKAIRDIIKHPEYKRLWGIRLRKDSDAASLFMTYSGACVEAVGIGGTITGKGAGIKYANRFGGAIIIDDIHKSSDVMSDTIREKAIDDYHSTLENRRNNSSRTPIVFIGQRQHEADCAAHLLQKQKDEWYLLKMQALDETGNALDPAMDDVPALKRMQEQEPYFFAAQMQQDPQPAGGGIFKENWFKLIPAHDEPKIIASFITADTAETNKTYNDATVFSLWGLYNIKFGEAATDEYGLYWLDCVKMHVEPADLESQFQHFYLQAVERGIRAKLAAIEKKSTGVTLLSLLHRNSGIELLDINRTKASGSKTTRYLEMQPYIARGLISLPENGRHTKMCIEEVRKITLNDTHAHDDITDTLYDAVKIALIDKVVLNKYISVQETKSSAIVTEITNAQQRLNQLRQRRYYGSC